MESKCVVCHERPARHRCLQCHKPTCDTCAFKTENGVFCGRECSARYREYKQNARASKKSSGGLVRKLVIAVVVLAVAYFAAKHFGLLEKAQNAAGEAGITIPGGGNE